MIPHPSFRLAARPGCFYSRAMPAPRLSLRSCRALVVSLLASGCIPCALAALDPADTFQPVDTQPEGQPPPPSEAVASLQLPEGFSATLFAAEPDVRQPIHMTLDARGRVWVCESYSYKQWGKTGEDRIIILEDTDGDGSADARKVFSAGFHHLSSCEIGFGGVWVLDSPRLLFIPDADGDDVPDGEPEVLLEGWTTDGGHNMVNGLVWGPDGWLYGRHGITEPSLVGAPGATPEERTFIEPGVWRFHPLTRVFEVVLRGMTNPWGMDWDERGEMFLSGNVNGHLWHGIPGALYERMFGSGSVPHDYERLSMIGERPHYPSSGDWRQDWLRAEKGRDATSDLGGGHSHCGLLIYQSDNWPEEFRGRHYMANVHGRRINMEALEPRGSTFLSRHLGDLMVSGQPWFRGVTLLAAPDGSVLVSDWCDHGECHDDDGVHRSSGRIYRIVHGRPGPAPHPPLPDRADAELVRLTVSPNEWQARMARHLLQQRALTGGKNLDETAVRALRALAGETTEPRFRLRALWTLHSAGLIEPEELMRATRSADPSTRIWGARLMCDDIDLLQLEQARLLEMARQEPEARVRLHLASLIQRVPPGLRWPIAHALLQRPEDSSDNTLQLVLWHGIEPLVPADAEEAVRAVRGTVFPKLRRFIARRLASEMEDEKVRDAVGELLRAAADPRSPLAEDVLAGLAAGVEGRAPLQPPAAWPELANLLLGHPQDPVRRHATALALAFHDAGTLDRLQRLVADTAAPVEERQEALEGLIRARPATLPVILRTAFSAAPLRLSALRGMAAAPEAIPPADLIAAYAGLAPEEKAAVLDVLVTRRPAARALIEAIGSGRIPAADLTSTRARLILSFNDAALKDLLSRHWGNVGASRQEREKEIEAFHRRLSAAQPGDPARGRPVFDRLCGACHRLFGSGGSLGPDLTGSGRRDLDYLLRNTLDPSAIVPRDYRLTVVEMKDGQVLSGVVPREDEETLTLQTLTERRILPKSGIASVQAQPYSWMPEGLLQSLPEDQLRDLIAYLRAGAPPAPQEGSASPPDSAPSPDPER